MTTDETAAVSSLDRALWWVAMASAGTSFVMILIDAFDLAETSGDLRSILALAGLLIFLIRPRAASGRPDFVAGLFARPNKQ